MSKNLHTECTKSGEKIYQYKKQQQHIIIIIIMLIKIIRIIMRRRTTHPICWERRILVVYNVENIYYNCNWFISIKLKCFEDGKNIPFNLGFFLIYRVQKLLIRSLHLKVLDWGRKSSHHSATDWNKWSIAKWHYNTKIQEYPTNIFHKIDYTMS